MKRNPYNDTSEAGGLFAWFARNHVAANLLMIAVVVVGVLVAMNIRQEIYPTYAVDTVEVSMQYRGASPEELEQSIILPIESELRGLEMTKRILSSATEGSARVTLEILPGFDRNRALQEVTAAVARISLFPDEIEPPGCRSVRPVVAACVTWRWAARWIRGRCPSLRIKSKTVYWRSLKSPWCH